MAEKHPYTSGGGGLTQAVNHLRKTFPATVTSDTLKKLGIASNNETYIINILRFIGLIDEEGKKTAAAGPVFSQHENVKFQQGLATLVADAYKGLFGLHGEAAWTLGTDSLISFFRGADHTSSIVGTRQAQTFRTLAALSGHGDAPATKTPSTKATTGERKKKSTEPKSVEKTVEQPAGPAIQQPFSKNGTGNDVGLTVRIEINLPAAGDQDTYDRIFKSIRENLLRGE